MVSLKIFKNYYKFLKNRCNYYTITVLFTIYYPYYTRTSIFMMKNKKLFKPKSIKIQCFLIKNYYFNFQIMGH